MDDLDQRANGQPTEAAPLYQSPPLFPQPTAPVGPKRSWLIAATAAATAFALGLGIVTAMWLGARGNAEDATTDAAAKQGRIDELTTAIAENEEEISSLEGEANGLRLQVSASETVIGRAQKCIRGIVSFNAFKLATVMQDCKAVIRYRQPAFSVSL